MAVIPPRQPREAAPGPGSEDEDEVTIEEALFEAIDELDAREVKLLLDEVREDDGEDGLRQLVVARDSGGRTPLHRCALGSGAAADADAGAAAAFEEAEEHSEAIASALIAARADPDAVDGQGDTPLLLAARRSGAPLSFARALLNARADAGRASASSGETPLVEAARHGNEMLCLLLVESGVDPVQRSWQADGPQESAEASGSERMDFGEALGAMMTLRAAVRSSNTGATQTALRALGHRAQAVLGARDLDGQTLLHVCASQSSTATAGEVAQLLVQHRAKADVKDGHGRGVLELASEATAGEGPADRAALDALRRLVADRAPGEAAGEAGAGNETDLGARSRGGQSTASAPSSELAATAEAAKRAPRSGIEEERKVAATEVAVPVAGASSAAALAQAEAPPTQPERPPPAAVGPLAGVRVVEACSVVAGPLSTGILADMGADVIKVEPCDGEGDQARLMGTCKLIEKTGEPVSALFSTINRGKRSITLDLKSRAGQVVIHDLVRRADCFVQSYRPGVAKRLGVDYRTLSEINPGLIMVSISGFGQTGPYKKYPVYDGIAQAQSGMAWLNKDDAGNPSLVRGTLVLDKVTPQVVARSVCAALFARERASPRVGQHIEVSMMDVSLEFSWPDGMSSQTFLDSQHVRPGDNVADSFTLLPAVDGSVVVLMSLLPELAESFAPEVLREPGVATHGHIRRRLSEALPKKGISVAQLSKFLEAHGLPAVPAVPESEVHMDPQVRHSGSIRERDGGHVGPVREACPAPRFSGTPLPTPNGAPLLGEHTVEVLEKDLGYSSERLAELQQVGALGPLATLDEGAGLTSRSKHAVRGGLPGGGTAE